MNPFIQFLMQILRANSGARMAQHSARASNAPGGPGSNAAQTPEASRLMAQLYQSYLNPGGGRMGNDTVGGGDVFGGFYRGAPLASYRGVAPNVGNIGWLSGNSPQPYHQSTMESSLQPAWGAQNWFAQFMNDLNSQAQGGANTPYGPPTNGGGGLFGGLFSNNSGAQFHGGGPGMEEFLNRGTSLASMDDAFRGGGAGALGGGYSTNLYF